MKWDCLCWWINCNMEKQRGTNWKAGTEGIKKKREKQMKCLAANATQWFIHFEAPGISTALDILQILCFLELMQKKKINTDQSSEHKNGTYYKAAFVEVQNVLAHKKLHISIQLMAIKWEWFGAMELKLNQTARWLQKHILWWTYSVSTKLCHKLYMKSINLATIESMNSDRMYYDVLFWNLGMNISAIHASRWRKVRLCIITASSVAGILSMWMSTIRL